VSHLAILYEGGCERSDAARASERPRTASLHTAARSSPRGHCNDLGGTMQSAAEVIAAATDAQAK
jgi:hypothetical protein